MTKVIHTMSASEIAEWEREVRATGWPKNRGTFSGITHGTNSTYAAGCRCASCVKAGRAVTRERYRRERNTD